MSKELDAFLLKIGYFWESSDLTSLLRCLMRGLNNGDNVVGNQLISSIDEMGEIWEDQSVTHIRLIKRRQRKATEAIPSDPESPKSQMEDSESLGHTAEMSNGTWNPINHLMTQS
jgi:hypothetical protein